MPASNAALIGSTRVISTPLHLLRQLEPVGRRAIEVAHGQAERRLAVDLLLGPAGRAASIGAGRSAASRAGRSASFTRHGLLAAVADQRAAARRVPGARAAISRISSSSFATGCVVERDDHVVGPEAGAIGRRARR